MTDFPVTVFHNPACGTSRKVVAMIEAAGYRPEVVEYLKAGWTADQLTALFAAAGITAREALREKGSPAAELGLLAPDASDESIRAAMVQHPVLVNRPMVRTPKGAALCRPADRVFDLLDRTPDRLVNEDGPVVDPA
ncbi:MAG: arsenate reductase (glutaredoxin) [Brevundimonas sp.]